MKAITPARNSVRFMLKDTVDWKISYRETGERPKLTDE